MNTKNTSKTVIFISYSHKDYGIAKALAVKLEEKGYDVWFDEHDIIMREKFTERIEQDILTCSLFVPIVSCSYVSSPSCGQELYYAHNHQKPLYPIYIEDVPITPEFDFILNNSESQDRTACNTRISNIDKYIDNVVNLINKYHN